MRFWWNRNARDIIGCWPVAVLVAIPFVATLPHTISALVHEILGF